MKRIDIRSEKNLTMLVDFYELTMMNGYLLNDVANKQVVFDVFYRKNPDNGGYAIMCGLQEIVEYINDLHFDEDDINYLRSKGIFSEEFLEYLKNYKFTGDIYAIPEGTPVFPYEPLITVKANIMDAQLIETMLLLTINHQSLIATKAYKIKAAAGDRLVMEFGGRRSHGISAAIEGARAAYIGGVDATATTLADQQYGVPAVGTIAHSWIQLFGNDYDAMKACAKAYPDNCSYLVDTFDVLNSGIPAVIKVNDEILKPQGKYVKSVRLDSGDLAYLTKKMRKMLDDAGMEKTKIIVSNSLDEKLISDLLSQDAPIDSFGVGERLITAKSDPVFGGVYKLAAVEENGVFESRIKISENVEKITNPGFKKVYRLYDNETKKAIADVITFKDEIIDDSKPYEIFDPIYIWKKQTLENFTAVELQVPIFVNGKQVYDLPDIKEIREYREKQMETLYEEVKRLLNPHIYYVDLSKDLWFKKQEMLMKSKYTKEK